MTKIVWLCWLILIVLPSPCVADAVRTTPSHLTPDSTPLPLQGRAIREVLWIDVYRIGLYFADDVQLRSLLTTPAEVAVRIEILTDRLPEEPPDAWAEVFRDHLSQSLSRGLMQGFANLDVGDVLWFVHDDSGDSTITINQDEFAVASGYGLMRAMLKLWIGQQPVSEPLREELIDDSSTD